MCEDSTCGRIDRSLVSCRKCNLGILCEIDGLVVLESDSLSARETFLQYVRR